MLASKSVPEKSKAPKDPDAPKRFLSPFFLYCAKERAEVQKELSSCNGAEVTKELGKRWADLEPEAKKEFELASMMDKERYEEDMKSYKPSENFLKRKAEYEAKAKLPTPVVADRLLNPVEDYFTFLLLNWRQVHLANQGYSGRQTQDEVWRAWQARGQTGASTEGATSAKKVKAAKDPLAPKKPPSAFFLFCIAKRAELTKASPNLKNKEVTLELGRVWNQLGEEEKAPHVSEAAKRSKEYKVELENYLKKNQEKLGDMEVKNSGDIEGFKPGDEDEVNMEAGDDEVNMQEVVHKADDGAEKEDPAEFAS